MVNMSRLIHEYGIAGFIPVVLCTLILLAQLLGPRREQ